ncbi:MAG: hypothetical protein ABIQ99_17690 [Thermoflexales bacterium]
MALLSGVNVWRVGEAIGLARAIPDLATATPPLLMAGYGSAFAIAFAFCAGMVLFRHRWAPLVSVLTVVLSSFVLIVMQAGLALSPEFGITLGFRAIIDGLALLFTVVFACSPQRA